MKAAYSYYAVLSQKQNIWRNEKHIADSSYYTFIHLTIVAYSVEIIDHAHH